MYIRRSHGQSSEMADHAPLALAVPGHGGEVHARISRAVEGAPPHLYFVVSAVFHYLGPAFAVLLFQRVDVLGVAWLRIVSAALVLALWRRPWRRFPRLDRSGQLTLVAWGGVLEVMNGCFYLAIARPPWWSPRSPAGWRRRRSGTRRRWRPGPASGSPRR